MGRRQEPECRRTRRSGSSDGPPFDLRLQPAPSLAHRQDFSRAYGRPDGRDAREGIEESPGSMDRLPGNSWARGDA